MAQVLVKVLAAGFLVPSPTAYLRDPWNLLDFFVVIISLISMTAKHLSGPIDPMDTTGGGSGSSPFASLKTLRALRALRPLRMISRNPGMKLVVNSLLRALPGVANVFVVVVCFLLIFGILGVQLFMGKFGYCAREGAIDRAACDALGEEWVLPDFGDFDNVLSATLTLFEMTFLERWPEVMYHGMDVVDVDVAPRRGAAPAYAFFFIAWIFIGAFCVNNLVVGVVVANFTQIKEAEDVRSLLTAGQREWVDIVLRSSRLKPRKTYLPTHPLRRRVWALVRHHHFEVAIMGAILVNVLVMATFHCVPTAAPLGIGAGSCVIDAGAEQVWNVCNYIFAVLYFVEMLLKLVAYGRYYFVDGWNVFDFCLVLARPHTPRTKALPHTVHTFPRRTADSEHRACGTGPRLAPRPGGYTYYHIWQVLASLLDLSLEVAAAFRPEGEVDLTVSPSTLRILRIFRISRLLRLVRHTGQMRSLLTTFISALPSLVNNDSTQPDVHLTCVRNYLPYRLNLVAKVPPGAPATGENKSSHPCVGAERPEVGLAWDEQARAEGAPAATRRARKLPTDARKALQGALVECARRAYPSESIPATWRRVAISAGWGHTRCASR